MPFRAQQMRLRRASTDDARWPARTLTRAGRRFHSLIDADADGTLRLVR